MSTLYNDHKDIIYIYGKVQKGKQLARKYGVPTANIYIDIPDLYHGVYIGKCIVPDQDVEYKCILNIGNNPTFNEKHISVEVHIFQYNQDIYDKDLEVFILEKLRDEIKFDDEEALFKQIDNDLKEAKMKLSLITV